VLPEVASTIVPPGWSTPRSSASSTIARRDPVLDAPARVEPLELGEHSRRAAREAGQFDERRRADRAGEARRGLGDFRGRQLDGQFQAPIHDNKKSPGKCRGSMRLEE
jgi:hypothetical protein